MGGDNADARTYAYATTGVTVMIWGCGVSEGNGSEVREACRPISPTLVGAPYTVLRESEPQADYLGQSYVRRTD